MRNMADARTRRLTTVFGKPAWVAAFCLAWTASCAFAQSSPPAAEPKSEPPKAEPPKTETPKAEPAEADRDAIAFEARREVGDGSPGSRGKVFLLGNAHHGVESVDRDRVTAVGKPQLLGAKHVAHPCGAPLQLPHGGPECGL